MSTETPTPQPERRRHQWQNDKTPAPCAVCGQTAETAAEVCPGAPDLLAHLDMTCRHGVDLDLDMDECDECAASPVPQVREDGAYREQIARALASQPRLADLFSNDPKSYLGEDVETPKWRHAIPSYVSEVDAVMAVVSPLLAERDEARSQVDRTFTETRGQIVEMARGNAAAMNEVRAERDRLRLAWLSAARGRTRARIERDTLGEQIEPYGECDPSCDCGDHQGRSCGCHVTGEEARTWLRQQDEEIDQLRADLKARTAERDRAQALLAEIGYGEDHSWRIEKEAQERITELAAERDEALQAASAEADLLDEANAELERWRSGQRRRSWPVVESIPDCAVLAGRLLHAQGAEGGERGEWLDELLRKAAQRLSDVYDQARVLLAERDRLTESRFRWAEEAAGLEARATQAEAILSVIYGQENYAGTPAAKVFDELADLRSRLSAALSEVQRWKSVADEWRRQLIGAQDAGARSVVAVMPADLEDQLRFVLEETPYIGEWPDDGGLRVDEAYAAKKLAEKIAEWCVATPDAEPVSEAASERPFRNSTPIDQRRSTCQRTVGGERCFMRSPTGSWSTTRATAA